MSAKAGWDRQSRWESGDRDGQMQANRWERLTDFDHERRSGGCVKADCSAAAQGPLPGGRRGAHGAARMAVRASTGRILPLRMRKSREESDAMRPSTKREREVPTGGDSGGCDEKQRA
eukprot:5103346-Pleurochrysis_carterae.AAC.9